MTVLVDRSVGAIVSEGLKSVTYPPVVLTWGGWDSTCGILYHSHHRTGAGPGKTHQRSVLWSHSTAVGDIRSTHVVLGGSTHVAALAFYALPAVCLHSRHHYGSELQTGWVACVQKGLFSATKICNLSVRLNGGERTWAPTVGAGHQLFWLASLVVGFGVTQAEVTVIIRQCKPIWTLLWSCEMTFWDNLCLALHWIQQTVNCDNSEQTFTFRLIGQRQGRLADVHLFLVFTLLLGEVGVGVMVTEARTVFVALPTDCQNQKKAWPKAKTMIAAQEWLMK